MRGRRRRTPTEVELLETGPRFLGAHAEHAMNRALGPLDELRRFFAGGSFPLFVLSLLVFYELLVFAMLSLPGGDAGLLAFAEEFRVWCLGYDPATGRTEWVYVMAMIAPQLMVGAAVVVVWWEPLRESLERPRAVLHHAAAALTVIAATVIGFALLPSGSAMGDLAFPAEALRTAYDPPELQLTNQNGSPVDLESLRGKVVALTAVYASCPHTCPLILAQSKNAVAQLTPEERAELRVVAVTMDPANDTPEVLRRLAGMHDLEAPLYNLVTGEPDTVEGILDRMGISRRRDPETGVIDHANLFLLLDRKGTVAYRLGLGDRQERWLTSALQVLIREPS